MFGACRHVSKVPTCDMACRRGSHRRGRMQDALWLNLPPLLARCVFFLKTAFEYLSRVLSRKSVPKFDNSRDLKVCELHCEELLYLSCSQRCLTVRLHCSNERLPEFNIRDTENRAIGHPGHADQ